MDESIKFVVNVGDNEGIGEILVDREADVFKILLNNEEIFSGDWCSNLKPVIQRALEIWG